MVFFKSVTLVEVSRNTDFALYVNVRLWAAYGQNQKYYTGETN